MELRHGRTGQFWGCARYPACRHTVPIGLPGITCPTCGGPVVERIAKRTGKPFWPCGVRGCQWVSWTKPHLCKACGAACFGLEPERRLSTPEALAGPGRPGHDDDDHEVPF
jgi:ssDNA-binding Zn-finger/Zn-ribbon topoisomerase 1